MNTVSKKKSRRAHTNGGASSFCLSGVYHMHVACSPLGWSQRWYTWKAARETQPVTMSCLTRGPTSISGTEDFKGGCKYSLGLSSLLVDQLSQFWSRQAAWSSFGLPPNMEIITLFKRAEVQTTTDFYTNPVEVSTYRW